LPSILRIRCPDSHPFRDSVVIYCENLQIGFPWTPPRGDQTWDAWFSKLKDFYRKHGHCDAGASIHGIKQWLTMVRRAKREKNLNDTRVRLLTSLDFDWSPRDNRWMTWYAKLKAFSIRHGHGNVRPSQNKKLYNWLALQRLHRRNKKLSASRFCLLDELDIAWGYPKAPWGRRLAQLVAFCDRHGRLPKASDRDPKTRVLYAWVGAQQRAKNHGEFSLERLKRIRLVGLRFIPCGRKPHKTWVKLSAG
jgi:hypothetical protein